MLVAMVTMFIGIAHAQVTTKNASFGDNWFVGANVGAVSRVNHSFDWGQHGLQAYHVEMGAEVGRWITPVIGIGASGELQINSTSSKTGFDVGTLTADMHVNLSNLFYGYKGTPRNWEVEAIPSVGYVHYYGDYTLLPNHSFFALGRVALSANYNFGNDKQWTVYVRPGIQYGERIRDNYGQFDIRAGIVYHIKGLKSKSHNFVACPYTVTQVDYDAKVYELNTTIEALKAVLSQKPAVIEVVKDNTITKGVNNSYTVSFEQGKSNVGDLSVVASALNATNGLITIIGGTSPEGSEEYNSNLGLARANAVKDALVKAGVDANRITVTSDYTKQRRATIVVE